MHNADESVFEHLASRAPASLEPAVLRLTVRLASSADLPSQLDALARYVESTEPDMICSIMLADSTRQTLVLAAGPGLPRGWQELVETVPIREGEGSCGTAAARNALVVVPDVSASPLWTKYAAGAARSGLAACWSRPFSDPAGGLLGTLALYYRTPRTPTESELKLIDVAASLAALVTTRHRELAEQRTGRRRLKELVHRASVPLLVKRDSEIVFLNQSAANLLGRNDAAGVTDLPLEAIASLQSVERLRDLTRGTAILRFRTANGTSIPVRVTAMSGPGHRPASVVLTCVDLRAQMRVEQDALEAAEDHVTRLSNDLNNEVCQRLAGIEYLLAGARPANDPALADTLRLAQQQLQRVRRDTSLLATWLRPTIRGLEGVEQSLADVLQDLGEQTGRSIRLHVNPDVQPLVDAAASAVAFPILIRLVRHAALDATCQDIDVGVSRNPQGLAFRVSTGGAAFAPSQSGTRFGDVKHQAWRHGAVLRFGEEAGVTYATLIVIL